MYNYFKLLKIKKVSKYYLLCLHDTAVTTRVIYGLLLKHMFLVLWKKHKNSRKLPGHRLSVVQCFSHREIIMLILENLVYIC